MISLIVNADDLGINPERDRGIIEAFKQGVVTSATVIANGQSFSSAGRSAKEARMPVGVHLNLSEGVTLTGPIRGLTGPDDRLPGKVQMRRYLLGSQIDLEGIRREFAAQIETVMTTGLEPLHLDGHQHCQAYPPLTTLIIELAREFGLQGMRSSCPADSGDTVIPQELNEDMILFRRIGGDARELIRAAGLKTPEGLWGVPLLHSLDTGTLCTLLENLPDGSWELMTHPGYPVPGGRPFEGAQRLTELRALCSAEAKAVIRQHQIKLCTFGDLPCAA